MATVVNDRDVLIMSATPRFAAPTDRAFFISPENAIFKVTNGIASPSSFNVTPTLLNMTGTVSYVPSAGISIAVANNGFQLNYSDMTVAAGNVVATLVVDGVTYTRTFNVSKVVDGIAPKIMELAASSQVFKVDKANVGTPGSIELVAYGQNLSGTPNFTIVAGTATLAIGSDPTRKQLTFANMASDLVSVKVTQDGQEDTVTIVKVREGADGTDAITAFLTNESQAVPANVDGTTISLAGASTSMKIYNGTTDDSANGWYYSAAPLSSEDNLTYTLTGLVDLKVTAMNAAVDSAYVDITATKAGFPTMVKRFTISKSKTGASGTITYTWVKYATSAAGAGLSDSPDGMSYIGFAYNKSTPQESTTSGDYQWMLFKGTDGDQGVPGDRGADGTQYWTWIKYSDVSDGTGLYDTPNAGTLYIGLAVNKLTQAESANKADYVWSKFKGDQGVPGQDGRVTYTWVKYATSAAGAGLTDSPEGMSYMGLAYNKATPVESTTPTDYQWVQVRGTDGEAIKGDPGADGIQYWTWIKYSDVADGTGLYDTPNPNTMYLGLAVNRTSATESTNKADYVWSKFKGDQGVPGPSVTGPQGTRGNVNLSVITGGSSWSDAEANAAVYNYTGTAPRSSDIVNLYRADRTWAEKRIFDGFNWSILADVFDGSILVKGSVLADAIDSRGLSIKDTAGNVILSAGSTLAQQTSSNPNLCPTPLGFANFVNCGPNRNGDAAFRDGQYIWMPISPDTRYVGAESPALSIPPNSYYTVSFEAYCTGASRMLISDVITPGGSYDSNGLTVALDNVQRRYSYTEQMGNVANAPQAFLRLFSGQAGASEIVISNIKVELGTKVTPWCDSVITASNASTFIASAAIKLAHIDRATIGSLEALTARIGKLQTAYSGARTVIQDNLIAVFDGNNIRRIALGDSTLT